MSDSIDLRRRHVIDAAIGVFLRYGYARTTMADIAEAAGLSRPTLYLTFADKEAIFASVIETMVANKLADIHQGLPDQRTVAAKLAFACEAWGAEGFDLVRAHPDAKDMFDLGFAAVCASYRAFGALVADIVAGPISAGNLAVDKDELARVVVYGIKGFKDVARDGQDLRKMIAALVAVVAAALEPEAATREAGPAGDDP